MARHLVDGLLDRLQAVSDLLRLLCEVRAVDVDAVLLHRGKDFDERQLDRFHEVRELLFLEFRTEQRVEAADGLGLPDGPAPLVGKRFGCHLLQVLLRELRQGVLRALRLQEVRRELNIKEVVLPSDTCLVVALKAKDGHLFLRFKQAQQRGEGRAVFRREAGLLCLRSRHDGKALERDKRREALKDAGDGQIRRLGRGPDGRLIPEIIGEVLCGRISCIAEVERQLGWSVKALEIAPDGAQLVRVTERLHLLHVRLDAVVRLDKLDLRHMELDRRELLREACLVGVFHQALLELLAGDILHMCEHVLDGTVGQQQLRSCLRADPRDARDVIGRIAHESLEIDELERLKAILLLKGSRVVVLEL